MKTLEGALVKAGKIAQSEAGVALVETKKRHPTAAWSASLTDQTHRES